MTAVSGIANARYMPLLERTVTVPASHEGGPRNQAIHEISIVVHPVPILPNTVILVLDDICTTGSTLRACKAILERGIAGAEVNMLAIEKTQ